MSPKARRSVSKSPLPVFKSISYSFPDRLSFGIFSSPIQAGVLRVLTILEVELDLFSQAACQDGQQGKIAVFYTVWSYSKGAGREIVNTVAKQLHDSERATRFVTLSPLTEMAERFHIRNGAKLLEKHDSCQNFEYDL